MVCVWGGMCVYTVKFFSKTVHIEHLLRVSLAIIPHFSRMLLVSIATELRHLDRITVDARHGGGR